MQMQQHNTLLIETAKRIETARTLFVTASGCFTLFQKLLLDAFPT
jgi:hypothetical protein